MWTSPGYQLTTCPQLLSMKFPVRRFLKLTSISYSRNCLEQYSPQKLQFSSRYGTVVFRMTNKDSWKSTRTCIPFGVTFTSYQDVFVKTKKWPSRSQSEPFRNSCTPNPRSWGMIVLSQYAFWPYMHTKVLKTSGHLKTLYRHT